MVLGGFLWIRLNTGGSVAKRAHSYGPEKPVGFYMADGMSNVDKLWIILLDLTKTIFSLPLVVARAQVIWSLGRLNRRQSDFAAYS